MKKDTLDMINEFEKYVLIKSGDSSYSIGTKDYAGIVIYDGEDSDKIIKEWLKRGIEVFDSREEYYNKYPMKPIDKIKAEGMEYIYFFIPREKWTQKEIDYFENDIVWLEHIKDIDKIKKERGII